MSDLNDDKDLERRFDQLRSGDRVSLRSLEALLASRSWRVPKRPRSLRLAMAMLFVLVVVVVTVIVQTRLALQSRAHWPPHSRASADSLAWSGPSDILLATLGVVAQSSTETALSDSLVSPEVLLQNEARLDLKPDQRAMITQEVQQLQIRESDLRARMSDEGARLAEILGRARIGENEALTQLDRVLAVEREAKRARLSMLIRIKNVLTPEQQRTAKGLR